MKKIVCIAIVLLFLLTLAGCGPDRLELPPIEQMNPDIVAAHAGDECCKSIYDTLDAAVQWYNGGMKDSEMNNAISALSVFYENHPRETPENIDDRSDTIFEAAVQIGRFNYDLTLIREMQLLNNNNAIRKIADERAETPILVEELNQVLLNSNEDAIFTNKEKQGLKKATRAFIEVYIDYFFSSNMAEAEKIVASP